MMPNMYVWLRRIEREDVACLWEWNMNNELAFFNAFTSHKSKAQFEMDYEENIRNPSLMDYLIVAGDDKKPVGFCGLKDINWVDRYAEIFISICDDQARKQGVATVAILMLVKIAFLERNLNKLVFKVSEHNARMLNLIETWGFTHEGVMREMHYFNNKYYDLHIYGVLKYEINDFIDNAVDKLSEYLFPGMGPGARMQIKEYVNSFIGLNSSPGDKMLVTA